MGPWRSTDYGREVYSMNTYISAIRIARQPSKLKVVGSNPTGPANFEFRGVFLFWFDGSMGLLIRKALMVSSYTCIIMNTKAKIKCWGNSLGIVLPKALVDEEGIKEGEEVEVTVRKVSDVRSLRGKYPFKNLQHEKDEMKRGWE